MDQSIYTNDTPTAAYEANEFAFTQHSGLDSLFGSDLNKPAAPLAAEAKVAVAPHPFPNLQAQTPGRPAQTHVTEPSVAGAVADDQQLLDLLTSDTLCELGVLSSIPLDNTPTNLFTPAVEISTASITGVHHNLSTLSSQHPSAIAAAAAAAAAAPDSAASACLTALPSTSAHCGAKSDIDVTSFADHNLSVEGDEDEEEEEEVKPTKGRGSGKSRLGLTKAQLHQRRLEKNRLSARRTRARKKAALQGIHSTLEELQVKVPALEAQVHSLSTENAALKARIAELEGSAPSTKAASRGSGVHHSSSARERASSLIAAVNKRIKKEAPGARARTAGAAVAAVTGNSAGTGLTLLVLMFGLGLFMSSSLAPTSSGSSSDMYGPAAEPWKGSPSRVLAGWQDSERQPWLSCSGDLLWSDIDSQAEISVLVPLPSLAAADAAADAAAEQENAQDVTTMMTLSCSSTATPVAVADRS